MPEVGPNFEIIGSSVDDPDQLRKILSETTTGLGHLLAQKNVALLKGIEDMTDDREEEVRLGTASINKLLYRLETVKDNL